jgi:hypothetical protein
MYITPIESPYRPVVKTLKRSRTVEPVREKQPLKDYPSYSRTGKISYYNAKISKLITTI